jgi:hypothetical protein
MWPETGYVTEDERRVLDKIKALSRKSQSAGLVPGWIREEIKETWKTARQCGSQMEAFRIFGRMTDRLGYGRMDDNPSLAAPNVLKQRLGAERPIS